jgi:hypothetical protein
VFSSGKMFVLVCYVVKALFVIYALLWMHDKEIHRKIINGSLDVKLFMSGFSAV